MALLGPQKGPFRPRKALLGAPEGLGVPWGACFWLNCHWLVQRDDPHPYHVLGPLNGPLWHSWGPQKGPFGPRKALLWAPEVLRGPRGTYFWPNCHWLTRLAEPYPYHVLQPLQRPLRHSWGPLGFSRHSIQPKWSPNKPNAPHPSIACCMECYMCLQGYIEPPFQPQGPQKEMVKNRLKRVRLGPKCPF